MTDLAVYTIGHSTHEPAHLAALLERHGVTAVGDVRSSPYSRFNPQYNRETLQRFLRDRGIAYVFLGRELGARSEDPRCYEGGRVRYDRLAATGLFRSGIERVIEGAARQRIALLCAEKDPLECHRAVLVARELEARGVRVNHILEDGTIEPHARTVDRLLDRHKLAEEDLFRSRVEREAEAFRLQGERIAWTEEEAPERALAAPIPADDAGSGASA